MKKVEISNSEEGSFLNLPKLDEDFLPSVTIVTPTYNRHNLFSLI